MANTVPDLRYSAALASLEDTGRTHDEAVLAILPDWLEWEWYGIRALSGSRHGGGCAPEGGIEWFGLCRTFTPEWAAVIWDDLSEADRDGIEAAAIEKIKKDRRENV